MKSSNTVATIIIVVAVLIAAYAVGLLVRQARVGRSQPVASEANEAVIRQGTAKLSHAPGAGRAQGTPEQRAQLKDQRAQALEKMAAATPEQKEQFRQQVREHFSDRRDPSGTQPLSTPQPGAVQDPNTRTKSNSEKTGDGSPSKPNAAGQG